MKRFLLAAAAVLVFGPAAEARGRLFGRPVGQVVRAGVYAAAQPVGAAVGAARAGLMDGHAASMAAAGRLFHSGRYVPGAAFEGVGFSSVSPDDAVRRACFWGQRQPVDISVRQGAGGWYAVVQYR